jgi:hypothetical protein
MVRQRGGGACQLPRPARNYAASTGRVGMVWCVVRDVVGGWQCVFRPSHRHRGTAHAHKANATRAVTALAEYNARSHTWTLMPMARTQLAVQGKRKLKAAHARH